jgi:hypothetical protein
MNKSFNKDSNFKISKTEKHQNIMQGWKSPMPSTKKLKNIKGGTKKSKMPLSKQMIMPKHIKGM